MQWPKVQYFYANTVFYATFQKKTAKQDQIQQKSKLFRNQEHKMNTSGLKTTTEK